MDDTSILNQMAFVHQYCWLGAEAKSKHEISLSDQVGVERLSVSTMTLRLSTPKHKHPSSCPANFSIAYPAQAHRGAGLCSSYHRVRGNVHQEQVASIHPSIPVMCPLHFKEVSSMNVESEKY